MRIPLPTLLLRFTVVGLAVLAALLAAETAVRLGWLGAPPPRSPAVVERRQPSVRIAAEHRDRRPVLPKVEGRFRVLVVGDSFTWGGGVLSEDAYPDRLATRIRRLDPASPVEVLNWSRPAWNTAQEVRSLRREIDLLAPDLLVVGYCLNDAEPTDRQQRLALREGVDRRSPEGAVGRWLYARSRLARALFEAAENLRLRRALARYYHDLYGEQPGHAEMKQALAELRGLAERRQIKMLLVIFPIFDSQLDRRYPYRELHRRVAATAEEIGVPTLDLLASYEGIDARRLAVEPFTDAHPNELAHRIASQRILEYLVTYRLLPDSRGLERALAAREPFVGRAGEAPADPDS